MLIKIATDVWSVDRIDVLKMASAALTTPKSLTVSLLDTPGDFFYDGDYADIAYKQLVPKYFLDLGLDDHGCTVFVKVSDIDWANLSASFNGQPGVEIRLRTDGVSADGTQITRQYTGDFASAAYDQITAITGTDDEAQAGASR